MKSQALQRVLQDNDLVLSGELPLEFDEICSDSRDLDGRSEKKLLFFARKGLATDGHRFLTQIEDHPKIAGFVVEHPPESFKTSKSCLVVRDTTRAMAMAAKLVYEDPSKDLFCFAVTGTNGKTTSAFLVWNFLNSISKKAGLIGTVMKGLEAKMEASSLTTPDFVELQKHLLEFKSGGAQAVSFEASSHALDQSRILGIDLDAAAFTNLSPEHLDYHQNMEEYFSAKKKLFAKYLANSTKARRVAVLPIDGGYGSRLAEELQDDPRLEIWSWGFHKNDADPRFLWIKDFSCQLQGSKILVNWSSKDYEIETRLVGEFNIENIAGFICFALSQSYSFKDIQDSLLEFPGVPGRLEAIQSSQYSIFVDYAHTPDALENVLMTLRPLCSGRLLLVFGCGGDRDRMKRPKMGEIAELYADEIFVTSDNPRTENPTKIINEILAGMHDLKPKQVEMDRRKAIEMALGSLSEEDVLLIAGKGHENYQIIGEKRVEFDDREVVKSYLNLK